MVRYDAAAAYPRMSACQHYVSTSHQHISPYDSVHMVRCIWFGTYGSVLVQCVLGIQYRMVRYPLGIRRSVIGIYGKGVISNCILWSTLQVALLCTELLNEIQFSSVKVSTKSKHGGPVPVLN